MINLELGLNVVALTLKEDTPESGYSLNSYLFKFFSHATNDTLYFLGQVQNSDKERYSQVNITLVNSIAQQDLTVGTIYLPNTGFYEYTIYAQISPDIIPQTTDVLCEQGRVLYGFNEATITSFSPDIETIIYNG